MIDNCAACQKTRPSQQPTPMAAKKPSESQGAPLEHVGTDLFEYAGKHHSCIVDSELDRRLPPSQLRPATEKREKFLTNYKKESQDTCEKIENAEQERKREYFSKY